MPRSANFEEIERHGAERVIRATWPGDVVEAMARERLDELGRSLRLPGFRPGKIPAAVLSQRYGARARKDALCRLAGQAAADLLTQGSLASSAENESDTAVRLRVTHLPDLPPLDPAALVLELLTARDPALAPALEQHLRRQILDYLDAAYAFPVAPALVDREYSGIRAAIDTELDEAAAAELRVIAERRVRLGAVIAELARRNAIHIAGGPSRARESSMESAVIAWILRCARVTERPASEEEIADLAE